MLNNNYFFLFIYSQPSLCNAFNARCMKMTNIAHSIFSLATSDNSDSGFLPTILACAHLTRYFKNTFILLLEWW